MEDRLDLMAPVEMFTLTKLGFQVEQLRTVRPLGISRAGIGLVAWE